MTSAMTVVPKNGANPQEILELSSLNIAEPSVVHVNLTKDQISKMELVGANYVLTLVDGRKVTIGPIANAEIALTNPQGGFDKVVVKEVDGQTVVEYQSVTDEEKEDKENESLLPLFMWIAGGASVVGAGIAIGSGSGGGSSSNEGEDKTDGELGPINPDNPTPEIPETGNGGEEVVDPTVPTVPTNPETPDPVVPTNPETPDPTDPETTDPTDPETTDPTNPETPDPTEPVVPAPEPEIPTDPETPDPTEPVVPAPEPEIPTEPFLTVISAVAGQNVLDFRDPAQALTTHIGEAGVVQVKTNANQAVKLSFTNADGSQFEAIEIADANGDAVFTVQSTVNEGVMTGNRGDVILYENALYDQHYFSGLTTGATNIEVALVNVQGNDFTQSVALEYDHFFKPYSNLAPTDQVEDASSDHFAFSDLLFETTPNSEVTVTLVRTGETITYEAINGIVQVGRAELVGFEQIYNDDTLIISSTAPNGDLVKYNHTITVSALENYAFANGYEYTGYYKPNAQVGQKNEDLPIEVLRAETSIDKFILVSEDKFALDSKDAVVEIKTVANAKVYLELNTVSGKFRIIESIADENGIAQFNIQSSITKEYLDQLATENYVYKGEANTPLAYNYDFIEGLTSKSIASVLVVDPITNTHNYTTLMPTTALYVEAFSLDEQGKSFEGAELSNAFQTDSHNLTFLATLGSDVELTHVPSGQSFVLHSFNGIVTFSENHFLADVKTGDQFTYTTTFNGQSTEPQTINAVNEAFDDNVIYNILNSVDENNAIITHNIDGFNSLEDTARISDDLFIGLETANSIDLNDYINMTPNGNNAEVYIDRDGLGTNYQAELFLNLTNINGPVSNDIWEMGIIPNI